MIGYIERNIATSFSPHSIIQDFKSLKRMQKNTLTKINI